MAKTLFLRPHHLLCMRFFEGRGYDARFVENMYELLRELEAGEPAITLVDGCDAVCAACPENREGRCANFDKVRRIDRRALDAMGLDFGDTKSRRELDELVQSAVIAPGKLKDVCGDCEWLYICTGK